MFEVMLLCSLLFMGLVWVISLANLRAWRQLDAHAALLADPPFVSILVPARNEAANIEACLRSLAAQDYPACEVLVLDDDSTDATPDLAAALAAAHPHVTLLRGQPLPPGWLGKQWACHQLAQAARGDLLLFTDADTRHAPAAVRAAVAASITRRLTCWRCCPGSRRTPGANGWWCRCWAGASLAWCPSASRIASSGRALPPAQGSFCWRGALPTSGPVAMPPSAPTPPRTWPWAGGSCALAGAGG